MPQRTIQETPTGDFLLTHRNPESDDICVLESNDGQMVILYGHPGDELFAYMYESEVIEQMKRAKQCVYSAPIVKLLE